MTQTDDTTPKRSATGFKRLIDATIFSIRGFKAAWRNEAAFRQEVLVVAVLVPASFWVGTTPLYKALLVLSSLLILVVELLNSAIETAIDRIGPEHHPLSARAKDMGSTAVMLILMATGLVWALAVWDRWGALLVGPNG